MINRKYGLPKWPMKGPWAIDPACTYKGLDHNTTNSAIRAKVKDRYTLSGRCTCPHGRDLREKELERYTRRREERKARLASGQEEPVKKVPNLTVKGLPSVCMTPRPIPAGVTPDFRGAACRSRRGALIADEAMSLQLSLDGQQARDTAKSVCLTCPLIELCRRFVTAYESPAGSWGGVWAGMDPWARAGTDVFINEGGEVEVTHRVSDRA